MLVKLARLGRGTFAKGPRNSELRRLWERKYSVTMRQTDSCWEYNQSTRFDRESTIVETILIWEYKQNYFRQANPFLTVVKPMRLTRPWPSLHSFTERIAEANEQDPAANKVATSMV